MPIKHHRPEELGRGIALDITYNGPQMISFKTKLGPAVSIEIAEIMASVKYPYAREVMKQWLGEQMEIVVKQRNEEIYAEARRTWNKPTKYSLALSGW